MNPESQRSLMQSDAAAVQPFAVDEKVIEQAWFDAAPRHSSVPPPPTQRIGEFLGDELADSWLR